MILCNRPHDDDDDYDHDNNNDDDDDDDLYHISNCYCNVITGIVTCFCLW